MVTTPKISPHLYGGIRLSKKSRFFWAFSSFCGIMFLGDEIWCKLRCQQLSRYILQHCSNVIVLALDICNFFIKNPFQINKKVRHIIGKNPKMMCLTKKFYVFNSKKFSKVRKPLYFLIYSLLLQQQQQLQQSYQPLGCYPRR